MHFRDFAMRPRGKTLEMPREDVDRGYLPVVGELGDLETLALHLSPYRER